MILTQNQDFQKVLKAEKLLDLSQFYSAGLCDEVPLYSRHKQVSFLLDMTMDQANQTLLAMGLDFLESIIKNHPGSNPFLAALTVWQDENDELIVPSIFVCNTHPRRQLEALMLHKAKAPFSKKISKLVRMAAGPKYLTLEESKTLEDDIRVFIGPKAPACANLVTVGSLLA
jgi:hypothetical protein